MTTRFSFFSDGRAAIAPVFAIAGAIPLFAPVKAGAQLPAPVVAYSFENVAGSTVTNLGSGGTAYNATLSNTATIVSPSVGGAADNALKTSNTTPTPANAYFQIPSLTLGTKFTIFTEVMLPNLLSTSVDNELNPIWTNSGGGSMTSGIRIFVNSYNTAGTAPDRKIYFESGNGTAGKQDVATTLYPSDTAGFHSLAFSVDTTANTLAIYLDGVAAGTFTSAVAAGALNTAPSGLGSFLSSNYNVGEFDDFQIFNTNLSATQVAALSASPNVNAAPEPGALALIAVAAMPVAGLLRRRAIRR